MSKRVKELLAAVGQEVSQPRKAKRSPADHTHPRTPNQEEYVRTIRENSMIWAIGPAGSGKTRLAVAAAVEALQQRQVQKIIISRPAIGSEDLGAVPGTNEEKVAHFIAPVVEFLKEFMGIPGYDAAKKANQIDIVAVGYMRGRNLNQAFVIVDEAQNCTLHQLKTIVNRIGEGSKMVITGDPVQSDLPHRLQDGYPTMLRETIAVVAAANKEKEKLGVSFAVLDRSDILRHRIVQAYVTQFEKSDKSDQKNMTSLMTEIKDVIFAQQQIIFDEQPVRPTSPHASSANSNHRPVPTSKPH